MLTAREVARRLKISARTVWRWVAQGALPAPVRLRPHSPRWRAADIESWLAGLGARRGQVGSPTTGGQP